ncbi:MAG: cytochrome b [Syntrophorhabdaceae bacterium]
MSCRKLKAWIDERYNLEGVQAVIRAKSVPSHRFDLSYFTGGVTLFLFFLQFITGIGLALYYVPHPQYAFKSIVEIVTKLNMGWFFRSLHHWGAQLTIAALLMHFFTNLLLKTYRKPRELLWVTGFVMLGICVFAGLSGYFLLWDERAFTAIRVVTGGAGSIPVIGKFFEIFLRGGLDVTGETLTRFYALHISILPLVSIALIAMHVLLVQFHGMSVPLSQRGKEGKPRPFFPNVFYEDLIVWLIAAGIVVSLAVLIPPGIGIEANPLAPSPENIKPEWYFLFVFQTLKLFPGQIAGLNGETIAILLVTAAMAFLFLIPFLDRRSSNQKASPVFTVISLCYVVYFVIMTIIGFLV